MSEEAAPAETMLEQFKLQQAARYIVFAATLREVVARLGDLSNEEPVEFRRAFRAKLDGIVAMEKLHRAGKPHSEAISRALDNTIDAIFGSEESIMPASSN